MNMEGVALIGWLHAIACAIALVTGGWNIVATKGTSTHRLVGRIYFYVMLFANLSTLGIYHFDIAHFVPFAAGPNVFGLFHWEAVFTLVVLLLGVYAAPRQRRAVWAYVHPIAMLTTYYMLMGGLINELFVRVSVLRAIMVAHQLPGSHQSPVVGAAQSAAMLVFLIMVIVFAIRVAMYRRRAAASPA